MGRVADFAVFVLERPKVAWVEGDCKVRPATQFVGCVYRYIRALSEMRTHRGNQMSASGKANNTHFMWINVPFHRMQSDQPQRALCILQRRLDFRIYASMV